MNLGLRHLRCIAALHRMRSFTLAAETVGVSQPALSRTVAEVERRLGVELFERTSRGVDPTPAGAAIAERAESVVRAFDDAIRYAAAYSAGQSGSIRLVCLPSTAATVLPRIVARFREAHPSVQLTIEDSQQDRVLPLVASGEADLGVVAMDVDPPAGVRAEVVIRDEFLAAVPAGHRLASAECVRWTDFEGEPFVAFDSITSIGPLVSRALAQRHVRVAEMLSGRSIAAVGGLVAAGMGVTAVPRLVVPLMKLEGLVVVPLEAGVERSIAVVHRERVRLPPAAELLRESLVRGLPR